MTCLPQPRLTEVTADGITYLTDDALADSLGVRVCFTGRDGGVGAGPYGSLNLGAHVGDDSAVVEENRSRLLRALGASDMPLLNPNQVHGTDLVRVTSPDDVAAVRARIRSEEGCDGIVVDTPGVAALLCFADCVPVILVAPDGAFAVVHAGWRGAVARIVSKAARELACGLLAGGADGPASAEAEGAPVPINVYIGPHIGGCCFECGEDIHARFTEAFGPECSSGPVSIDLSRAIVADLAAEPTVDARVADCDICTQCNPERYFSYRASGGVCGRHGALAFRKEG